MRADVVTQRFQCARRGPSQRGAVLVELALLLPLLLALTLATVEFAQALAAYKVLVTQVRSAARYLSTQAPGTSYDQAQCLLTHGVVSAKPCSGQPLMPGLVASGFSVGISDAVNSPATQRAQRSASNGSVSAGSTLNLVTVTASGYRQPLQFAAFLSGLLSGTSTLSFGPISCTMRQTL